MGSVNPSSSPTLPEFPRFFNDLQSTPHNIWGFPNASTLAGSSPPISSHTSASSTTLVPSSPPPYTPQRFNKHPEGLLTQPLLCPRSTGDRLGYLSAVDIPNPWVSVTELTPALTASPSQPRSSRESTSSDEPNSGTWNFLDMIPRHLVEPVVIYSTHHTISIPGPRKPQEWFHNVVEKLEAQVTNQRQLSEDEYNTPDLKKGQKPDAAMPALHRTTRATYPDTQRTELKPTVS
ncbi:hypothetical protein EX30DRAFT_343461 [Ascodesmis nigricans]|uniref:Uncharacterized protein n=1 Tax=Ascodesmis nigricans TaxID=341454 RepID=A0A4S2MRU9_9PEZI|nr:hypothetical protein EX30DRAFT_343461 [Ascodesmis nigricans]